MTIFLTPSSRYRPEVTVLDHANGQPIPAAPAVLQPASPHQEPDERVGRVRTAVNWLRDSALSVVAMLLVLAVAAAGWSASFISLHQFAMLHMALTERQAWLVPGTFDGAAGGLSMLAFRAAIHGRASLGSRLYVYGFTGLSSWINYVHIDDPRGQWVASLLPISAVVMFDKTLREARAAFERRTGRQLFRVRPGLLLLRLLVDRKGTWQAVRTQVTAVPVPSLIGLGTQPPTQPETDRGPDPVPAVDTVTAPAPKPDRKAARPANSKRRSEAQLLASARRKFKGQRPTAEAIRQHLGVGLPIARQLRDLLLAEQTSPEGN